MEKITIIGFVKYLENALHGMNRSVQGKVIRKMILK